jgi:adenine deaminase
MKRYALLSVAGAKKTKEVIDVIQGRRTGDLAIKDATLLNVYTGEYLEPISIVVKGEWIAYVGDDPGSRIGPDTTVIPTEGRTVIPGLIDGHSHLANFEYNPAEFLRYAIKGGTTTIVTEIIEPFPIGGYEGLLDFLEALNDQPIKIFSTVPAMASTSKAARGMPGETLKKLMQRDDIQGLGEAYWSSVLQEPGIFLSNFQDTLVSGKKLEGHTSGARGTNLMAYIAPGISSCHEPINRDEVLDRLRMGIHVMMREGSIREDLEQISPIKDDISDFRRLILVTDGVGSKDLVQKGYMERVVQRAIDYGFEPIEAVKMATSNVADYFQLDGIIGGIAPGKYADIVIIPEPTTIRAEWVISKGRIVAKDGALLLAPKKHTFSHNTLHSVHFDRKLQPSDFTITCSEPASEVKVRVIDQATRLVTRESVQSLSVSDGEIRSDVSRDVLKVAVIDRTFSPGKKFVGLIRGHGLKNGAFACSSAWDVADIIVVGADDVDMAAAVNRIYELQGGAVVCSGGEVLAEIPLPIFGLMSELPMEALVRQTDKLIGALKELGFPYDDPIRTITVLTGAAIPFLRICEDGLVDIKTGKSLSLFVESSSQVHE